MCAMAYLGAPLLGESHVLPGTAMPAYLGLTCRHPCGTLPRSILAMTKSRRTGKSQDQLTSIELQRLISEIAANPNRTERQLSDLTALTRAYALTRPSARTRGVMARAAAARRRKYGTGQEAGQGYVTTEQVMSSEGSEEKTHSDEARSAEPRGGAGGSTPPA